MSKVLNGFFMQIVKAKKEYLSDTISLLKSNELPFQDIDDHMDQLIVLLKSNAVVGCVGMEIYGKIGLLRSLAVDDSLKGEGYGKKLTSEILDYSKKKNLEKIYLLTTTAKTFFEKLGFVEINRNDVDIQIKETNEYKYLCPDSATNMVLSL